MIESIRLEYHLMAFPILIMMLIILITWSALGTSVESGAEAQEQDNSMSYRL